ncbi:MAG TPA: proteasome accessory factor PafA2 family protein, partial [Microthrixaceae bacterium]|nr:proteasome accessory factor PafA2 family protein [Microthrixaceae bacterium]
MAIPKICGIETEYGILVRGAEESNPISASSILINSYLAALEGERGAHRTQRVGWNFDDESPGNDAREEALLLSLAPEVETHLVNAVLTNGARYYVDHAHPEYSCPEAPDARTALVHDRAGEEILIRSMAAARAALPEGQEIVVYKNNSDGKGNSYGCHENFLVDRAVPFGRIVAHATAHLVTRQIFTGAGKVGSEAPGMRTDEVPFQLTQRADFFEEEVGLETTLKRPIINTRDEPHADAQKYRRLHVITGDANLSEVQTFLKLGTTALVLAMIEDDALGEPLRLARPVAAMQAVSWDLSLAEPLEMADGSRRNALDLQWDLYGRARAYAES